MGGLLLSILPVVLVILPKDESKYWWVEHCSIPNFICILAATSVSSLVTPFVPPSQISFSPYSSSFPFLPRLNFPLLPISHLSSFLFSSPYPTSYLLPSFSSFLPFALLFFLLHLIIFTLFNPCCLPLSHFLLHLLLPFHLPHLCWVFSSLLPSSPPKTSPPPIPPPFRVLNGYHFRQWCGFIIHPQFNSLCRACLTVFCT